ncbi:MAG: hypothetical protein H0W41_00620 [Chloroflexi bacterium]|nr:hypothetical protein [Chloroflexota bacterium]
MTNPFNALLAAPLLRRIGFHAKRIVGLAAIVVGLAVHVLQRRRAGDVPVPI